MLNQILSTTQVAKLCNVAPRTACKWIDDGILKGFCVPNSRYRRVKLSDLVEFMQKHNMPYLTLGCVITIGLNKALQDEIVNAFRGAHIPVDVIHTESNFVGGYITRSSTAEVGMKTILIIDLATSVREALDLAFTIKRLNLLCTCLYIPVADLELQDQQDFEKLGWKILSSASLLADIVKHVSNEMQSGWGLRRCYTSKKRSQKKDDGN